MKLIITMKLSNRNLLYHIYPLSLVENIEKIIIIRDIVGPDIKKVEYVCPPKWALKFPPFAFFFKMMQLFYFSIRERPHFIHSFLLYPHGILALIAAKFTGSRVVVSLIAGPIELYVLGSSPKNKYAYTNILPSLTNRGKILLKIVDYFDFITVAGSFTQNFLLEKGIPAKKIFYIPYIIVDEKCRPLLTQKIYDLIYIGRLAESKHIEVCIYTIKKIIDDYGLTKIKFCIVGDGPCKEKLEALSIKLNLNSNIEFLGYQSDITSLFNKAKLSIVTSERETGPFTAIESMMCGVPVISSRCGDTVNDLIRDGIDGYLIDNYDDHNAFAEKIAYLLMNDTILFSFSKNAINSHNIIGVDCVVNRWKLLIDMIMYDTNNKS